MLQGIWDNWASGANQDAANEAIRTGNPVNMGLLENFYGNKDDAENIVKKAKQDQLKSTYGSALAEVGLMVDWGEDEESVKSKLFRTRQERATGQENKKRAQAKQDAAGVHSNNLAISQQGIEAESNRFSTQLKSEENRYAHTSKENALQRAHDSERGDKRDSLNLQMQVMQNDLSEKRMDYDRETRRMDKRTAAIAQLMSGLGSLGGAFSL